MPSFETAWDTIRRRRATGTRMVLYGSTVVLLLVFFQLQILRSSQFTLQSERNRLRALPVPAARGAVYDRNGSVLAENVPGYSISVLPGAVDTVGATLTRLSSYLGIDEEERQRLLEKYRARPNRPLIVRDDASFEQVSAIEERRPAFRRVVVDTRPRRRYPAGRLLGHSLGYVGEISRSDLEDERFADYDAGRIVGVSGLERQYEDHLGGTPGIRYVEVNARGSIVREFGPRPGVPPRPGEDLTLGLDLELHEYADSIFPDSMRGGVVAMDPDNGEILLFYSHPGFDPNAFVGGIDDATWTTWQTDPEKPLLNRITGASYSPGSTWKLLVSTIAMRREEIDIDTEMEISCRGALQYGNRLFRCWRPEGHGPLNLSGAIKESCNVFFYQLGMKVGLDALIEGADRLGFNTPTGIDLPHEATGYFPTSRDWYDRRYGPRGWTESVALNLAIGQGENHQSLMRLALFYAALATGESPVKPHFVRGDSLAERRVDWSLGLREEQRLDLVEALERVVNEPRGTAYWYRPRDWTMAGKTGTAQNPQGEPHSLFVGFAPADDPRIVIAAIVEFGHPDDQTSLAVPFASRLVSRYLDSAAAGAETEEQSAESPAPAARTGAP